MSIDESLKWSDCICHLSGEKGGSSVQPAQSVGFAVLKILIREAGSFNLASLWLRIEAIAWI